MADIFNDTMNWLSSGTVFGMPVIWVFIIIGTFGFIIYLLISKKQEHKIKDFKPMDLKKETRRHYNKEYSYYGIKLNKPIYDVNEVKPFAWVKGYMKVVWMDQFKRYEPLTPIYNKEQLWNIIFKLSKEVYQKDYKELDNEQKKNINALAKEELRYSMTEIIPSSEKLKIVRGKKEVKYSVPVPCFMLKITHYSLFSRFLAFLGFRTDYFIYESDQINFKPDRVVTLANYMCESPNDIFVFSNAGKQLVQDISYGIERENIWQETANQVPRAVHFDMEASKAIIYRREEAKIQSERFKAQKEAND